MRDESTEGERCKECRRVYQPTNSCEPCPFCRVAELEAEVTTLKTQRDAFLDALRHAWVAFQILAGDSFLAFFGSEDSREAAEAAKAQGK